MHASHLDFFFFALAKYARETIQICEWKERKLLLSCVRAHEIAAAAATATERKSVEKIFLVNIHH